MLSFIRPFGAGLRRLLGRPVRLPLPRATRLLACLSVLGLVSLSFAAGTAVMYFQLPPPPFLEHAFASAKARHERGRFDDAELPPDGRAPRDGGWTHRPRPPGRGSTRSTPRQRA